LLLQVLETSREHFGKEEASLFPEAEKVLGVEKLSEFGDKWAGQRNISID
jgi:hemerythrin-like domain-containing protein